ncbi:hypothetical protein [Kaistella pullorum]|uniref:Uncharacterized protein n=1 Tax=Kaistella pullorum TaxID=2763074 RepID=A0ABR8WJ76_9FLAO|nr:hypothetical protein [Kaistella pullorum]MBD8017123.1 hypothetical protein [Kaistella pullorum]
MFYGLFYKLRLTSGVYGGLRLLPQISVQNPDFKLSENSDTKADFRNPPYTMLPPVRARNIIPERLSDHEMPEPVVLLSEKARISNAELITKTDFGPAEGSMGGNSFICMTKLYRSHKFPLALYKNHHTFSR